MHDISGIFLQYQITRKMKKIIVLVIVMVFAVTAFAEGENKKSAPAAANSAITGQVIDMTTGEALAGVEVCVQGTELKAYTDFDGNFEIKDLTPGTYDVVVSLIAYRKSLIENLSTSETDDLTVKLLEE
jgi:uncharacterized surface anchored protein